MKKIIFCLSIITLILCSCTKSVSEPSAKFKNIDPKLKHDEIVQSIRNEMAEVLSSNDFNRVDWNNGKLDLKKNDEFTFTYESNNDTTFIYYRTGTMKLYKIGTEVHAVY